MKCYLIIWDRVEYESESEYWGNYWYLYDPIKRKEYCIKKGEKTRFNDSYPTLQEWKDSFTQDPHSVIEIFCDIRTMTINKLKEMLPELSL